MTASDYFVNGQHMFYVMVFAAVAIPAALGFVGVALWRLGNAWKGAKHGAS